MTNKELRDLRRKIKATGLSYRQIYQPLGISKGWFMRTLRNDFHEPNPEWMTNINNFLDDFQALITRYK